MQGFYEQDRRSVTSFLETILMAFMTAGAAITSFIWIPVGAALSVLATLSGLIGYAFKKVWNWYDSVYLVQNEEPSRDADQRRRFENQVREDEFAEPLRPAV